MIAMKHYWTDAEVQWLKENYPHHTIPELTNLFSKEFSLVTESAIRTKVYRLGMNGKVDTSSLTPEESDWLIANHGNMPIIELTAAYNKRFGKSKKPSHISVYCTLRGLRKNKEKHYWTKEEEEFLKTHYPNMLTNDFVLAFNEKFNTSCSKNVVFDKARHLGVKATRSRQEHAKKAAAAHRMGIGSEMYNRTRNRYLVKTSNVPYAGGGNWTDKKNIVWQKRHGEIPDGMHVIQLDGDTANYDEDNLMLVSAWVRHKFRIYGRTHETQTRELMRTYIMAWQLMEACKENEKIQR